MTAIAIPALAPVLKPPFPLLFGVGSEVGEIDGVVVADAFAGAELEEVEVEEALVVNSPGPTAPPIVVMFA
jgi:hypothetical protein